MSILDTALGIEKMSISYYEELKENLKGSSLVASVDFLIEQEHRHIDFIKKALEEDAFQLEEVKDDLSTEKVLSAYKEELKAPLNIDNTLLSLYKKGIDMEGKSVVLYQDLLKEQRKEQDKDIVKILIEEEKSHKALLEGLLDLARHAEEWVEDPEFSHIGDQY